MSANIDFPYLTGQTPIGSPYWSIKPPYQAFDYLNSLEEAAKRQELLDYVEDLKDKFSPPINWQIITTTGSPIKPNKEVKKSNGYLKLFL